MATGGGSDNNDRPRRLRKREHEHLLDDNTESTRRPKSNKVPRRMGSEPVRSSSTRTVHVDPPVIDLAVPTIDSIRIGVIRHPTTAPSSAPTSSSSSSSSAHQVPSSPGHAHYRARRHGHFASHPRLVPYDLRPRPQPTSALTTPTTTQRSPITIDSDSEDDLDEVVILNETPPDFDMSQRWQDLIEDSVVPDHGFESETFGTSVSVRSIERQLEDPGAIPPVFTRLAGSLQRDALQSFLMVSVPHTTSQHDDVRRHFLGHHVTQIHPMQFISAIMGSGGTSFFGGPMGSYEDWLDLAERLGPGRPMGLPDDAIEAIPVRTYNVSEPSNPGKSNCVICMMDYEDKDTIKTLPCTHEYHSACIGPWLKQQRTCPICRNELPM